MAKKQYETTSEKIEVVEVTEITSVTVDVESGMTDTILKVEIVKNDGSILSTKTERITVPTPQALDRVNQAVEASSKVDTSTPEAAV